MRVLLWIVAIFGLAVALAIGARYNQGYVLLVYAPYQIEVSLNLFILLLVGAFFLAYALIRIAVHTLRLPEKVRAYRVRRQRNKARSAMQQALTAFFEGRFNAAEKAAANALELGEAPALAAVVAARSAHQLRAFDRRDAYLKQAESAAPEASLLRLITQAELLIKESRITEALDVLRQVRAASPKSIAALRLELDAQTRARNWDAVLALVPQLEKVKALSPAHLAQARLNALLGNLQRKAQDPQALQALWRELPTPDRLHPALAHAAAHHFIALGNTSQAREIIEQALEKQWDSGLAALYGDCAEPDAMPQIERAEGWLRQHPEDASLLLTLGKLCMRQSLWGKAQSYLEASLAVEPSQPAHIALAQLLEKLGRSDAAYRHYRKSLELAGRI